MDFALRLPASAAPSGAPAATAQPDISPYWYQRTVLKWRDFVQRLGLQEVAPPAAVSPVLSASNMRTMASIGPTWLPQQLDLWLDLRFRTTADGPGYAVFYQSYHLLPGGELHAVPMLSMVWRFDALKKQETHNILSQVIDIPANKLGKNITWQAAEAARSPHWAANAIPALRQSVQFRGQEALFVGDLTRSNEQLRQQFYQAQDGLLALDLYEKIGRDQVETELENYLGAPTFPRLNLSANLANLTQLRQQLQQNGTADEQEEAPKTRQIKAERVVTIR
jgi:hypothetical protein